MDSLLQDVRLPTVIVTALVDSINPCAIGVLILLVSGLLTLVENRKRMLFVSMIYISAVYITYFLAGLGYLSIVQSLNGNVSQFIGLLVGAFVVFLGLIDIKDVCCGKTHFTLAINPKHSERIKSMTMKTTISGMILLGIFVAAVELPCTGGPYLAITTLLSKQFDLNAFLYLALYNLIFVLPLIVITGLAYIGTTAGKLKNWKESNKRLMRLGSGIVMVSLGILLILYALNIISL